METKLITVRMDSGWLRVARGGSRAKAPPLAARPKKVAEKIPGTRLLSITYVGISVMSLAAVGIVPKSAKTFERMLCLFWKNH